MKSISTVIGVAHVNWPWLFLLGCWITLVAALATGALQTRKTKDRVRNLWCALAAAVLNSSS